jgi:hypothetical protein
MVRLRSGTSARFLFYTNIGLQERPSASTMQLFVPAVEEEANVRYAVAHHDLLGIGKTAPVDLNAEVAGGEAGKRSADAAREFVAWRARTDRFAYGERDQVAYSHGRDQSERSRASVGNGTDIQRYPDTDHGDSFSAVPRSCLPVGIIGTAVSHLGNLPPEVLAGTVEKLVAKMDDGELAAAYRGAVPDMPDDACGVFVEAIFDAFRERGESSEDVVEEAGTTLERVATRETDAVAALLDYAAGSPGLLKETSAGFVERRPDLVHVLPRSLYEAVLKRLAPTP